MHRSRTAAAPVAAMFIVLAGCSATTTPSATSDDSPASAPAPSSSGSTAPVTVASELEAPWSIAFLNGTPLMSERDSGRILEIGDDGSLREIGVVGGIAGTGEGGLLGLTIGVEGALYAYSTGASGNRIQRFEVDGTAGTYTLGDAETILDRIPAAGYHNGGRLSFGPDGMLYATTGDAGLAQAAQDPESLAGKILRMTPDGEVPADNPTAGSLVYSSGHRNPQGIAWADDGTLYAAEFGQDRWDELNIIEPGGNYGWPVVEGIADDSDFTDPILQWEPSEASPSGMTYADGALYIANLRGQVLRTVPVDDPAAATDLFSREYGRIRDVVLAPDGRLWFATSNTDGRGQPGESDDRIISIELTTE